LDFKHPKRKILADFAKIYPRNGPIDDPSCAAINYTPCMEGYRGFPENGGSPSYHPFIDGFSIINHPASLGYPIYGRIWDANGFVRDVGMGQRLNVSQRCKVSKVSLLVILKECWQSWIKIFLPVIIPTICDLHLPQTHVYI
jgi:hypothetical protein